MLSLELYFLHTSLYKGNGVLDIIIASNIERFDELEKSSEFGEKILSVCVIPVIILITETLPIQFSLDDGFVSLFVKTSETNSQVVEEIKVNSGEPMSSSKAEEKVPSNISEVKTNATIIEPSNNEKLVPAAPSRYVSSFVNAMPSRKRMSYKEYSGKNTSVESVKNRAKGLLINSKDIVLGDMISGNMNKLGKIFDAKIRIQKVEKQVAVRVIEMSKITIYQTEPLYQEVGYRNEYPYEDTISPLLGFACEPPKIFIVMPKYKTSLNQLIYDKNLTSKRQHNLMKLIVNAISYLHSFDPPLTHGHLTPHNIFIDEDANKAYITDIGFEALTRYAGIHHGYKNKSGYTSPELICSKWAAVPSCTPKSDIYSLGIILWYFYKLK